MNLKPGARLFVVLCGVAIPILTTVYFLNRRMMSAQEYYLKILPDPGFATLTPTGSERERITQALKNSGVSTEELETMTRESTPAKQLTPFLNDILRHIPAGYRRVPDVFAGVYPSGNFNASVIQTPYGGHVILVNYALKKSLWEWAKLVVNALALQRSSGLRPDDTLDRIVDAFVRSTREYADSGKVPAFPQYYATDEKRGMVILLHTAAMKFIVAHEYSHALLGHAERTATGGAGLFQGGMEQDRQCGYLTRELDADKLAVEIVLASPSEKDFVRLDPEIQVPGIYYSLAIYEALDIIRSGGVRGSSYPELSTRREAVRKLLERKTTAVAYQIVTDVTNAIDYLVFNLPAVDSGRRAPRAQAGARVADEASSAAESPTADAAAVDVRGLLDARGRRTAASDAEFISFMREFSGRRVSGDWNGMRLLVSNSGRWREHVGILLEHALACSVRGVKSWDLPWSPGQELNAGGFVELAATILAASQGKREIKEAALDGDTRSRIQLVWRNLYGTSLGVIGASDDPEPTQGAVEEAADKNLVSIRIAELLGDPVLMGFSASAGAWALLRVGDDARASSIRRNLGDRFQWPPIVKGSDGNHKIAYPAVDHLGNKIPTSVREVPGW